MSAPELTAEFPFAWFAEARTRGEQTMLLIDGAFRGDAMATVFELEDNPDCIPLFYQDRYKSLLDVSPFVLPVNEHSPMTHWFLDNKIFSGGGFFCSSKESPLDLVRALIPCLDACDQDGEYLLFRFYDPVILSALLLDGQTIGINRISEKISHVMVNYFDQYNQNSWGDFGKKSHQEASAGESFPPIVVDDEYIKIFDESYAQRMIHRHAIACAGLTGENLTTDTILLENVDNSSFTLTGYYAKKSIYVSDALYAQTSARLIQHESAYKIENFDYLAKCDLLLLQAKPESKKIMHETLIQTDISVGNRIHMCEQILENKHGGY